MSSSVNSPARPFTHSTYYDTEMGEGLSRCIVAFTGLMGPGELVKAKWLAHEVERSSDEHLVIVVAVGREGLPTHLEGVC